MKQLLLTWYILLYGITSNAQVEIVNNLGTAQMQKIIQAEGSAQDLYKSTYRWLSAAFKNPDAVLQGQIEGEIIRGKGSDKVTLPGLIPVPTNYQYDFEIEFKDGRLRMTMDQFVIGIGPRYAIETYLYKASGEERTNAQAQGIKKDISGDINALITSMARYLSEMKKEDDW